jgi:hypothetical protein
MMQRFRSHLSAANVLSMTALVIALGGTAYAASLPNNIVGSSQIKSKAVKNSDLGDSSVTSKKVKNRSLRADDFAAGQIVQGLNGTPGAQGFRGATGPTGPAGLAGTVIVRRIDVSLPNGTPGTPTSGFSSCAAGERIIGGSVNISDVPLTGPTMEVLSSRPSVDTTGNAGNGTLPANGQAFSFWKGTARALTATANGAMRIFAVCLAP